MADNVVQRRDVWRIAPWWWKVLLNGRQWGSCGFVQARGLLGKLNVVAGVPSWSISNFPARCGQLLAGLGVGLRGGSGMLGARQWLIVVACVIIRILGLGSAVGLRCANVVWVRSVRLGHLTYHWFARLTKLRTYADCRLCSWGTARGQQKRKNLIGGRFVVSSRYTIISI